MDTMSSTTKWNGDMSFTNETRGIASSMDAMPDFGGKNLGTTPKELVLNGMMGCTAMDVISMLKKMRQEMKSFTMKIEVSKNQDHPVHFKSATLFFYLEGEGNKLEADKVKKAVTSSLTKYCGVNYMISKTCKINFEVYLNQALIEKGIAEFIDPKN
ncbi:MAG: OsmC family protein [Bacteriovoracaceae bacterium]|nr:OsmC family protein [Bacteriovoracaceae bacterium]